MRHPFEELADRIWGEIPDLERIVERVLWAWSKAKIPSPDQGAFIDSVALNLHGFYSGLERIFELIAKHVDQSTPEKDTWHRDLLRQMSSVITDTRPAVIHKQHAMMLDEYRRFRHLVRNLYTMHLPADKIERLVSNLPALWAELKRELLAFADFLKRLAEETNQTG